MTNQEIYNVIIEFKKKFKNNKDAGIEFTMGLIKKINNSFEKEEIINFLFDEIKTNKYGLIEYAFELVSDINNPKLGEDLLDIFINEYFNKDDMWKEKMIGIFFKIKFKIPEYLVISNIETAVKNKKENVLYDLVSFFSYGFYTDIAIKYLSSYFVKYKFVKFEYSNGIINPNLGSILFFFNHITLNVDNLYKLIKTLFIQKKETAIDLVKIINLLISSSKYIIDKYDRSFLDEIQFNLNNIISK